MLKRKNALLNRISQIETGFFKPEQFYYTNYTKYNDTYNNDKCSMKRVLYLY